MGPSNHRERERQRQRAQRVGQEGRDWRRQRNSGEAEREADSHTDQDAPVLGPVEQYFSK